MGQHATAAEPACDLHDTVSADATAQQNQSLGPVPQRTCERCGHVCRAAQRHRSSSLRPRTSQQLLSAAPLEAPEPPTDPVVTLLALPKAELVPWALLAVPEWPPAAVAGQPFSMGLTLRNAGRQPQQLLVSLGDAPGFVVAGQQHCQCLCRSWTHRASHSLCAISTVHSACPMRTCHSAASSSALRNCCRIAQAEC